MDQPRLTASQISRIARAGRLAAQARTLTDHYWADRAACENKHERHAVWRFYALSVTWELARRGEPGGEMRWRKARCDDSLPVITLDSDTRWSLWQRRPVEELRDLYRTLIRARDSGALIEPEDEATV